MPSNFSKETHIQGLLRLINPGEVARAKRFLTSKKGREKWRRRLAHKVSANFEHEINPERGDRDPASLLNELVKRGAPEICYVMSYEEELDDTFQNLEELILGDLWDYDHGTFLSCVPGKLALFRAAWPERPSIVYRP